MKDMTEQWERVAAALPQAYSVTTDGCHKIYVAMDKSSHDQLLGYGYDMFKVYHEDEAFEILQDWYNNSCELKFIQSITECDTFDNLIAQFEHME